MAVVGALANARVYHSWAGPLINSRARSAPKNGVLPRIQTKLGQESLRRRTGARLASPEYVSTESPCGIQSLNGLASG